MARLAIALLLLLLLASPARADPLPPAFDDPRVAELIARVLANIGYRRESAYGGHIDVDGGDGLVIAVEPLDAEARRTLARRGPFALPDVLWWDEAAPERIARAVPNGRVALHNPVPASADFEIWHGKKLWRRITVEAHADFELRELPEGILRVRRIGATVDGWIYVTPWPSRLLRAHTHETFNVPTGRYRLHGWHPRGGERTAYVTAN